jgi:uncharacterized membrane-anchored protein
VLTKPTNRGGLNLGTAGSSAVLGAILVFFVWQSMKRERAVREALVKA